MTAAQTGPLLTVAIPTFNRAAFLRLNLDQLRRELVNVPTGVVEVVVSDNCSTDATPHVVEDSVRAGMKIRYVRNAENLGWGRNFSQCFDLAIGKYVLLLGDDDIFVDGGLAMLLDRLAADTYGVVCLGAYGYDDDAKWEFPGNYGGEVSFSNSNDFFVAVGPLITLISSCVVNKSLLPGFSIGSYADGDLAALPLVLRAAIAGPRNLFIEKYVIGGKRQNSFAYEYAKVFVEELFRLIDDHVGPGLTRETVRTIERDMLLSYYPFYLFDQQWNRRGSLAVSRQCFDARFGGRFLYEYWLSPIMTLPRPLAISWGAATTVIGRVIGGDSRRGLAFAAAKLSRAVRLPVKGG